MAVCGRVGPVHQYTSTHLIKMCGITNKCNSEMIVLLLCAVRAYRRCTHIRMYMRTGSGFTSVCARVCSCVEKKKGEKEEEATAHLLCSQDKVPLIFSRLVVYYDDKFTLGKRLNRRLYRAPTRHCVSEAKFVKRSILKRIGEKANLARVVLTVICDASLRRYAWFRARCTVTCQQC